LRAPRDGGAVLGYINTVELMRGEREDIAGIDPTVWVAHWGTYDAGDGGGVMRPR